MDIRKGMLRDLFIDMGYIPEKMDINHFYSVKELGYKIKSYDGFYPINKVVRKEDDFVYRVITKDYVLECSGNHLLAVKRISNFVWTKARDLVSISPNEEVLTLSGWQKCLVQATQEKSIILDIEVDNVKSYFTSGIFSHNTTSWGDPSETTGGKALRYYAAIRIDLRRTEQIKEKDETVGNKVKATIRKNKVSPPFKVTELEIRYDEGISQLSELIDYGITLGIIEKGGAWFTINDTKVQGMSGIRSLLKEDKAILQSIEDKVRIHLGMPLRRF